MPIDPQEEAERVRKALQNVEDWKQKYVGNGGFSGGIRMTVQTQDGVVGSRMQYFGDPKIRQKIAEPLATLPKPSEPAASPPKVITQPLPWWRRVLNFLFAEKTK